LAIFYEFKISQGFWGLLYQAQAWRLSLVGRYATGKRYICGRRMQVGRCTLTSFWGDSWCSVSPLKDMFPDLYNICNEQTITVAGAAAMSWIFPSRRWLTPDLILQEARMIQLMNQINLS
jgi:hypothetical protein